MEFSLEGKKKGDRVALYWSDGTFYSLGEVRGIRGQNTVLVRIDQPEPDCGYEHFNDLLYFKDGLSENGLWLTEVTQAELDMDSRDRLFIRVHTDMGNKRDKLTEDQLKRISRILNE